MAKLSPLDLIRRQRGQRSNPCPLVKRDLSSKTVVITGANTGLGLETAKHFASMNPARLILACRNKERGEEAVKDIAEATGYQTAELWLLDQGKFASIVDFADKFEQDGEKIDILVANAGISSMEYNTTSDGYEETIQVNHLSTALLCVLLLPHLQHAVAEGSIPRIVVVSSDLHYWATFPQDKTLLSSSNIIEKMSDKKYCTKKVMGERYNDSKLLNLFFVRGLASHLPKSSPIIIDAVNPGYCVSSLGRSLSFPAAQVNCMASAFMALPVEQGSRQLVWAAIGGEGREEELKGAYIVVSDVHEPGDSVLGKDGKIMEDRLWDDTTNILSKVSSRFGNIIEELRTGV